RPRWRPSAARPLGRSRSCSSPPGPRRVRRRSCGARCARASSARIRATCRPSRIRSRSRRSPVPSEVALVTGGGRGIGADIARELASAGMRVAVTGRTAEQVDAVAREIDGVSLVGDVSRLEDVERWFSTVGPLDLLVNNAGIEGPPEPFSAHEPGDWWRTYEVNVLGVYLCCRAALP